MEYTDAQIDNYYSTNYYGGGRDYFDDPFDESEVDYEEEYDDDDYDRWRDEQFIRDYDG